MALAFQGVCGPLAWIGVQKTRMCERPVGFMRLSPSHLKWPPSLPLLFAIATFSKACSVTLSPPVELYPHPSSF